MVGDPRTQSAGVPYVNRFTPVNGFSTLHIKQRGYTVDKTYKKDRAMALKTTADFLDALKVRCGLPSDYAIAQLLGVTRQQVSHWRRGAQGFSDLIAVQVAELLELDPMVVIAARNAERAKRTDERQVWEGVLRKLAGAAIGLVLGAWLLAGGDQAGVIATVAAAPIDGPALHIMRICVALALAAAFLALRTAQRPSSPPPTPQIAF